MQLCQNESTELVLFGVSSYSNNWREVFCQCYRFFSIKSPISEFYYHWIQIIQLEVYWRGTKSLHFQHYFLSFPPYNYYWSQIILWLSDLCDRRSSFSNSIIYWKWWIWKELFRWMPCIHSQRFAFFKRCHHWGRLFQVGSWCQFYW